MREKKSFLSRIRDHFSYVTEIEKGDNPFNWYNTKLETEFGLPKIAHFKITTEFKRKEDR